MYTYMYITNVYCIHTLIVILMKHFDFKPKLFELDFVRVKLILTLHEMAVAFLL